MQCFQKDPNLRVSARKLLKHAWIVGSRRTDAPVTKLPANFSEAVEEVKQWNEALKSPNAAGSLRASTRSNAASPLPPRRDPPLRSIHNDQPVGALITPAKGLLSLAKPKHAAEAFRSPESTGMWKLSISTSKLLTILADDNWDDDFASSISPSALHLPQFKPHDNFGGMLSSDRLKAFASFDTINDENDNWDHNFEGDLVTIKEPNKNVDNDSHELETIRPYRVKPTVVTQVIKPVITAKASSRKISRSEPPRPRSPVKAQVAQAGQRIVLQPRPAALYREQSVEDYSDLFADTDSIFDRRLNIVKVSLDVNGILTIC